MMLPFQVFRPSPEFNCHQITVQHYLSCGTYSTPFVIQDLYEFSKYKVNPFSKFTNCERKEAKDVVFVVIKGEGKFDGKMVEAPGVVINPVEVSATESAFECLRVTLVGEGEGGEELRENELVRRSRWSISKYELKEGSEVALNEKGKVFVFVNKGEITIPKKLRPLAELESILITEKVVVKAVKQSSIITVQLQNSE